ncbi:unnamed protein product [Heligmosomoides polygyrus]|uniref:Uncharacterized protein n=1 Tax=Heligmosomoides polygyrus TaxID=6339 RepID=A0A3P8BA49_HELPZ|nr:unnamed protein product [Heligmosomoides polygyrus]
MNESNESFTSASLSLLQGLIGLSIPTSIGVVLTYYRPQYIAHIRIWIKRVSWAATIVISVFAIYSNYYMFWLITWPIVICGCALPWLGIFKGIAFLLMYWCLPEPESDIAVTIIFVTAIMTDKPLVIVWLMSRIYKKCCKRNVVKQVDDSDGKVANMSTTTISTQLSTSLDLDLKKDTAQEMKSAW